jgi:RNA polymerase sigma-70 factor (ECF subfamily)
MQETSLSFLDEMRRDSTSPQWQRFDELYRPLMQSWLERYADVTAADRDDLVQDVLLTVATELPRFDHNGNPGAFRAWLRHILANRLRNFWKRRQRRPDAVGGSDFLRQLDELDDDASGLSALWDQQHDQHIMQRLLELIRGRFAAQTWEAFRLQMFEEKSPEETAAALALSLNQVYVAKSRVLSALRKAAEGLIP